MLNHIHFGAGALGLGFVGWLAHACNHNLILANRRSDEFKKNKIYNRLKDKLTYKIDFYDGQAKQVDVNSFHFYNAQEDPEKQLLDQLCDINTRLVTTAVTDRGLQGLANVLNRAIEGRIKAKAPPLFILPCENGVSGDTLEQFPS